MIKNHGALPVVDIEYALGNGEDEILLSKYCYHLSIYHLNPREGATLNAPLLSRLYN